MVPSSRISPCNAHAFNAQGDFVLYWMIANRRRRWNFALERAVHWAEELCKPLLVIEAVSCTYRWASTRIHTAILQGMRDNVESFRHSGALYHPFVERFPSQGKGMLQELSRTACVVITDDYPAFEIPRWIASAAQAAPVLMEKVDSNGIFPMRATDRVFTTASSFRRFLQKELSLHLRDFPAADPLADVDLPVMRPPASLRNRWPAASRDELSSPESLADTISIDRSVRPVATLGTTSATRRLREFVRECLASYAENRNRLETDSSSGLSAHLHFGHISSHEVFQAVKGAAPRSGVDAEAFLDQLITWRELGFNMCAHSDGYDRYASLPEWARKTLGTHAADPRPVVYSLSQFENAETHDALWNATQVQLRREGRIHNYLRMLWGKKILEWSHTPEEALEAMIHLNNKYALDGRDPNSYSGIFWILGRYDRPWGPTRPIFGTVRYMSSENTARKLPVKEYIRRYAK